VKPFQLLTRHFLDRFVHSDLVTPGGEITMTAGNILAFLAVPGLAVAMILMDKYGYLRWHLGKYPTAMYMPAALADKFFFITLGAVVVGFVTVLRWDALFPDLTDYMILTPLPLPALGVFCAKAASLAIIVVVLELDLNFLPSLFYPILAMWSVPTSREFAHTILSHAAAVFGASTFIFLLLLAVQGTLLSVLGYRWFRRISPYVQFIVLLWLGFQSLLISDLRQIKLGSPVTWFFPTLWFLGLYEKLMGRPEPVFLPLAHRAVMGLWIAALVAMGTYVIGYSRHVRRSLEAKEDTDAPPAWLYRVWLAAVNRVLLRDPRERATFHFLAQTVMRNATHRLFLSAYVGIGGAIVLEGMAALFMRSGPRAAAGIVVALYSLPLVMSFFLLSGLRVIFPMPAELRANWIFQLTEDDRRAALLGGVRKVVLALAIGPLFAALFPLYAYLWGWPAAALHMLYGVMLSWLLLEAMLYNFAKVPFTCSYHPGKLNLPTLGLAYFLAFLVYAYAMASFEQWLLDPPVRMMIFLILAAAALVTLHIYRAETGPLLFEDEPEPEVRTLGI
jgi:hypothetical protein